MMSEDGGTAARGGVNQSAARLEAEAQHALEALYPHTIKTLNQYVNDGIGYRMTPEQPLFYSWNSFGTADTISFRKQELRIHDLKTGVSRTSLIQLEVYAALFCLEYGVDPKDIMVELRIYQDDDVVVGVPETELLYSRMQKIIGSDRIVNEMRMEEME